MEMNLQNSRRNLNHSDISPVLIHTKLGHLSLSTSVKKRNKRM